MGTDCGANGLPCDLLGVGELPLIVPGHNNGDREKDTGGCQIGVGLDLGCRFAIAQLVNHSVNVRLQTLVGLPRYASRDDEVALRAPEFRIHTQ